MSRVWGREAASIASAPGRVNLIGGHTDYNGGHVLPLATQARTWAAAAARKDGRVRVRSVPFGESATFGLDAAPRKGWPAYVAGILLEVRKLGWGLDGIDLLIDGDVPPGKGLSSSASLEMAVLGAIEGLLQQHLDDGAAARLGRRVENEWLGVSCGVMDQMAARASRESHAMLLDCRSLQWRAVPVAEGVVVVIADTGVPRQLTGSGYNQRVAECARAVAHLAKACRRAEPALQLRDFTVQDLDAAAGDMDPTLERRARHVITENIRVLDAAEALSASDWPRLGALLTSSHESLRSLYDVSCPELDLMCDIAASIAGCHGSRMTGAGFGGCTIHLVAATAADEFMKELANRYRAAQNGMTPQVMQTRPARGVTYHRRPEGLMDAAQG